MRTTLFLFALLAGPALAGQTIWKWVDANGVTHYADTPVPGATRMEVSTGTSAGTPDQTYESGSFTQSPANSGPPYRNFEILRPANEETIPNSGGAVTVDVLIEPSLQSGHSIYLYLDGKPLDGFSGSTQSFNLTGLPRGAHSVTAAVVDSSGSRVQETAAVTFYVRQESAAQPPTGPALRPPPKPQPRAKVTPYGPQPSYAALNSVNTAPTDPVTNRPVSSKPTTGTPTTTPSHGK